MTQHHPITPPPELVGQWFDACVLEGAITYDEFKFAALAAQWGADQELEACCEYLKGLFLGAENLKYFRAARRPKLPSLKEQSLALIDDCTDPEGDYLDDNALSIIRRALEQLPDEQ